MADPLSIFGGITGAVGLVEVCYKVTNFLIDLPDAVRRINVEITTLSRDLEAVIIVHNSIKDLWTAQRRMLPGVSIANAEQGESLWKNVEKNLIDCKSTVENLELILKEVFGSKFPKVTGKLEGLQMQLRK